MFEASVILRTQTEGRRVLFESFRVRISGAASPGRPHTRRQPKHLEPKLF